MLTNHYWYIPEALTPEQCDEICHAAAVAEQVEGFHFGHDPGHRNSQISWIYNDTINERICAWIRQANIQAGWNYDLQISEALQYARYLEGGQYDWHIDGNQDHHAARILVPSIGNPIPLNVTPSPSYQGLVRKLSASVNLTNREDYSGGDLELRCYDRLHIFNDAPKGSIIVFPSFMEHRVTPVTSGERHAGVLWYNGQPLR